MSGWSVTRRCPSTLGVVLAGGLARRMGGADKPLLSIGGRSLLSRVVERLGPQCKEVVINWNGPLDRIEEPALPIVPDSIPGFPGPLAGILAALDWAALSHPSIDWVVSVPCDTPFPPLDLVPRLHEGRAASGVRIACAASRHRVHHAVGLWPVALRHDLREAITLEGARSIRGWAGPLGVAQVDWPGDPVDPFFNINTFEDLAEADLMVERFAAGF
jgi:molybdopterin-guanine dinucleotide biosynthesis protein A